MKLFDCKEQLCIGLSAMYAYIYKNKINHLYLEVLENAVFIVN